MTIDSNKQQVLNADPSQCKKISFTGNLDCTGNVNNVFIIEKKEKKQIRIFRKILQDCFILDFALIYIYI